MKKDIQSVILVAINVAVLFTEMRKKKYPSTQPLLSLKTRENGTVMGDITFHHISKFSKLSMIAKYACMCNVKLCIHITTMYIN